MTDLPPNASSWLMSTAMYSALSNPTIQIFAMATYFAHRRKKISASEGRQRSIALSEERMERFCQQCPYFSSCPGTFVCQCHKDRAQILEASGCPVRAVLDHIVDVFNRTDLKDYILKSYNAAEGESRTRILP